MRIALPSFFIILSLLSCKQQAQTPAKPEGQVAIQNLETKQEVNLRRLPDSLNMVPGMQLEADFNADNTLDFATVVEHKTNQKIGVLINHNSPKQEQFVFGAFKAIDNQTNLSWIEIIESLPKGEIIAPTLVDPETGDIIGPDTSKNFTLIGNGIYLNVAESHGGGIIFWNGNSYSWYSIE